MRGLAQTLRMTEFVLKDSLGSWTWGTSVSLPIISIRVSMTMILLELEPFSKDIFNDLTEINLNLLFVRSSAERANVTWNTQLCRNPLVGV